MSRHLCIHGHFYQPPREDPWLDEILPEGSAAPYDNWNQRICRESYEPLGFARRLDGQGRITEVLNCYEWMSFNFGPTLLRYLEHARPHVYARIVEGDAKSAARLGHGNALAQVCHHVILPLATPLDKELQAAWGKADFVRRFGRQPEGMWLAEAAVDVQSLEALAAQGVRFTILAPRQAAAVRPVDSHAPSHAGGGWQDVDEGGLDTTRPYLARLPSGRSMAVYFYNGPLSQAVAFERLLADGENFWKRVSSSGGDVPDGGLRSLATDGETYGHHFTFGEMALAYVLDQARTGRDGWALTNYAAHLAAHPPTMEVRVKEPSSWSCEHGVARWSGDCDCGGAPGWSTAWRKPLREALNLVKARADRHYFALGKGLFADARAALVDYGHVYAGAVELPAFERKHFAGGLSQSQRDAAWKLLAMQQWALAAFASCAWFFEDLARIEPVNAVTMALRAMDLGRRTGMDDLQQPFCDILARARSNNPQAGSGADIFFREVLPRCEGPRSLAAQGYLKLWAQEALPGTDEDAPATASWPGAGVTISGPAQDGRRKAAITWALESGAESYELTVETGDAAQPAGHPFDWRFRLAPADGAPDVPAQPLAAAELPWNKKQALASAWVEHAEVRDWLEEVAVAAPAAGLFLPWQEAQATQNAGNCWGRLFAPLAWRYVAGDATLPGAEAHMVSWLRRQAAGNPMTPRLAQRVVEHITGLLPDRPDDAAACLRRAHSLELGMDLFPAQNRFWRHRQELARHKELARLLWFAA